jgi:hypothetical protein
VIKRLTSDREGLRSRGSVCLGALSEGGLLGAVRSVDLGVGISFANEERNVLRGKSHEFFTRGTCLEGRNTPRDA